ncbi:flavin reductase family protein [Streptomyces sp. NPDC001714]|uniref:flavin reductase family protein n=1 Tax=Streptomyces sp. NPDC001714 TaxID=3364603 RepID=UPI003689D9AC
MVFAGLNHRTGYRGTTNTLPNFGEGSYQPDVPQDEQGADRRRSRGDGFCRPVRALNKHIVSSMPTGDPPMSETTDRDQTREHIALIDDASLEPGLSADAFREAFRNHAGGVAVVTADAGRGPVALTATSVISVSATPPLLVFSVAALSSATPTILESSSVVVHLLGAGQVGLARLCATSGADRFADTGAWARLATGEPYFVAAPVRIRGSIAATFAAGASILVVVNATHAYYAPTDAAAPGDASRPLVYHNRTWHQLSEQSQLVSGTQ